MHIFTYSILPLFLGQITHCCREVMLIIVTIFVGPISLRHWWYLHRALNLGIHQRIHYSLRKAEAMEKANRQTNIRWHYTMTATLHNITYIGWYSMHIFIFKHWSCTENCLTTSHTIMDVISHAVFVSCWEIALPPTWSLDDRLNEVAWH